MNLPPKKTTFKKPSLIEIETLGRIARGGGFTSILNTCLGSILENNIVVKKGFLNPNLWEQGDISMVDWGFLLKDYLKPLKVDLEIPLFLKGHGQFTITETIKSQKIANERLHVERMVQRSKCYHIFDRLAQINVLRLSNHIISMCTLHSNFQ